MNEIVFPSPHGVAPVQHRTDSNAGLLKHPFDLDETVRIPDVMPLTSPATRLIRIFKEWAARHAFDSASFAVMRHGRIVGRATAGTGSATKPVEFASCSKLITGLCIAQLVRQGRLGFDTTMDTIFGTKFQIGFIRTGNIIRPRYQPYPQWFQSLKISELLTHTSGINGEIGEHNPYDITLDERLKRIVMLMPHNPAKPHVYENNNYVVLGKVIEQITGKSFADACLEHVFAPLRITAFTADNRGPYAGCFLSTLNYARMLSYLDRELHLLGTIDIDAWPREYASGGHSIGTNLAIAGNGTYTAEHGGAWDWGDNTRSVSLGAHHFYWSDIRLGYFFQHAPRNNSPFWDLHAELDAAAHDPSNRWPPSLTRIIPSLEDADASET